jgi:hypothetical protein
MKSFFCMVFLFNPPRGKDIAVAATEGGGEAAGASRGRKPGMRDYNIGNKRGLASASAREQGRCGLKKR